MQYFTWFTRRFRKLPIDQQEDLINRLFVESSPGVDFYVLVILSTIIATFGLITDSPAVIIGAMLVAPLMSPIIAIGLASITGNGELLRNGISALIRGAMLSLLLSFIITLINKQLPFIAFQELPKEILSRTRPTPIDLTIALAGGLAAAYALSKPNLLAALPGVAIATALMPPLCAVGIGLAMEDWHVAGGAGLLFVTNAVTIAFASALIFFILGFNPKITSIERKLPKSLLLSALITVTLLIPLTYLSVQFFQEAAENRAINNVVHQEVQSFSNAELIELNINRDTDSLNMDLTIRTSEYLDYEQVITLQEAIVNQLNQPISLVVHQVYADKLDPLVPPTATNTFTPLPTSTQTPTITKTPWYTQTATITQTTTNTPSKTPTATYTHTPTYTPTPGMARVYIVFPPALRLYQYPDGPVIAPLKKGQYLTVLYRTKITNGIEWSEVMDEEGRIGWVPKIYLIADTATPFPSITITPTLE